MGRPRHGVSEPGRLAREVEGDMRLTAIVVPLRETASKQSDKVSSIEPYQPGKSPTFQDNVGKMSMSNTF